MPERPTDADSAKVLFAKALELDPGQRRRLLDEACRGRPELRREVESLLGHADRTTESFLSPPVPIELPRDAGEATRPERVGQYRIVGVLGHGGMGVVYRALQTEPVEREVALKVVHPGFDTQRVIARFRTEQRMLSLMDHPNVARVLDAGVTEWGSPFFVMELVDGQPVTTFCEQNELSTVERVQLFRAVCSGVQHAHTKGIIHRDLKPTNVLVGLRDGVPTPKVIDFGVAKATREEQSGKRLTRAGELVGTLEYMSPEQADASDERTDIRSDVFSLGVVLFEVLTGELPFKSPRGRGARGTPRTPEHPAPRPSSFRPTGFRDRRARADLDWIVLQAIELEPERRYQTVQELSDDLDRLLQNRPIAARPPTRSYLLAKFVARNRALVAALLVAILALLVGSGLALHAMLEARKDRDAAQAAMAEAEALISLFEEMFGRVHPSRTGREPTLSELLESAAESIPARLTEHPNAEARLRQMVGFGFLGLGRPESAEAHLRRAHELRVATRGPRHADTIAALSVLGHALYLQGKADLALGAASEVLEQRERAPETSPEQMISALTGLSEIEVELDRLAEARGHLERAVALASDTYGANAPLTIGTVSHLADVLYRERRLDAAIELTEDVVRRSRSAGGSHLREITLLGNLAQLRFEAGGYAAALAAADEGLALARSELPAGHWLGGVALRRRGESLHRLERLEEAEAALRESWDVLVAARGETDTHARATARALGQLLRDRGDAEGAARWASRGAEPEGQERRDDR